MPIAKMKRLQVLALERDHDALLRQLERMGCVEISEPDAPDAPESLRRCGGGLRSPRKRRCWRPAPPSARRNT